MAGVDVGESGGKKRAINSDINMVPFIDLLMVTIAFLLITAVWVTNSRISANAQVPGQETCGNDCASQTEKALHVHMGDQTFNLVWKQGATVIRETKVPRTVGKLGNETETPRQAELAKAIASEWQQEGLHRDAADPKADQAVLHSDDKLPFREIVAVLDALNATQRELRGADGKLLQMPVFNTTFATR